MITPVDAQARLISSHARTYDTASRPAPPSSSGTYTPMKPSDASSFRIAGGTLPCSSMSCAIGRSFSVAKSRAVRCTSSCDSVSERSNAAADSVLVVVVMPVLLIRVDADEPPLRVAREEVVALEFAHRRLRGLRLVEGAAHVVDAEPDHESGLRAHLGRRLAIVRCVKHEVGVLGLQPARVRVPAGARGQADDVRVERRDRGVLRGEGEHRTDLRAAHFAYPKKPRPLLRPSHPACTYWRSSGAGRYFWSPRSRCITSRIARQTSSPMRSASASGPIGKFRPFIIVSIASAVPTPSASAKTASLIIGMSTRFAMKPGVSFDSTAVLPSVAARSRVRVIVASLVCRPRMSST